MSQIRPPTIIQQFVQWRKATVSSLCCCFAERRPWIRKTCHLGLNGAERPGHLRPYSHDFATTVLLQVEPDASQREFRSLYCKLSLSSHTKYSGLWSQTRIQANIHANRLCNVPHLHILLQEWWTWWQCTWLVDQSGQVPKRAIQSQAERHCLIDDVQLLLLSVFPENHAISIWVKLSERIRIFIAPASFPTWLIAAMCHDASAANMTNMTQSCFKGLWRSELFSDIRFTPVWVLISDLQPAFQHQQMLSWLF